MTLDSAAVATKDRLNAALVRVTGYELRRPRSGARRRRYHRRGERLLTEPAFVLSSVRSGSTLLRVLLDSHSEIHSPPEMHLRNISVQVKGRHRERSLNEVGLEPRMLEYLLWDRLLHRELEASGKRLLVNKTPTDAFIADRIVECWPDARFIYLLRHPLAIARSRQDTRAKDTEERNLRTVLRFCEAVEAARGRYPGLTVRYEELAGDPVSITKQVCAFLGVRWEAAMLEYGEFDHGRYRPGLGDWKDKIRTGRVQPPAPLPPAEEIPAELRAVAAAWGYIPAPAERITAP